MRVLHLSQFFEPEPTFKGMLFVKALIERGHSVEVLTGFPNFPGGKIYPGYALRGFQREVMDGVRVNRVFLYPSHDKRVVPRSANYLSFAATASAAILSAIEKPDVVYVYHPPATTALPAIGLHLLRDVPYVLDVQDLWPDTIGATGMVNNSAAFRALGALAQLTYRHAARIIAQSDGFRATLLDRGVPADRVTVIHNWADERAFSYMPLVERADPQRLNVLFAGIMGLAQALDTVLDAAALARTALPGVTFTFIGGGVDRERLESEAVRRQLTNVTFLARRAPADMPEVFAQADILLVHLKDDPLFRITIPSKTQTYLAIGRPILMAMEGDAARMVEQSGGGISCAPGSPDAIVDALKRFSAMSPAARTAMGAAGRAYYDRNLSLQIGAQRFEEVFQSVRAR